MYTVCRYTVIALLTCYNFGLFAMSLKPERVFDCKAGVSSIALSPSGYQLVAGVQDFAHKDFSVNYFDISSGLLLKSYQGHTDWVHCVEFAPNMSYIVSGSNDGSLYYWDGKVCFLVWGAHKKRISDMEFNTAKKVFASCSYDGTCCVCHYDELCSLKEPVQIIKPTHVEGNSFLLTALAFSSDGNFLVLGDDYGYICLYKYNHETKRYVFIKTFKGGQAGSCITSLQFSPSGRNLLCVHGFITSSVRMIDVERASHINDVDNFYEGVERRIDEKILYAATFSKSGNCLFVQHPYSYDIITLDTETKKSKLTFAFHTDSITGLKISNDGKYLFASSLDGKISMWELPEDCYM